MKRGSLKSGVGGFEHRMDRKHSLENILKPPHCKGLNALVLVLAKLAIRQSFERSERILQHGWKALVPGQDVAPTAQD